MGAHMPKLKYLIDTNVWIDLYVESRPCHDAADALVRASVSSSIELYHAVTTEKDVFFTLAQSYKCDERAQGCPTEEMYNAIAEIAWACTEHMERLSTPVGQDLFDLRLAHGFRFAHNDLEDNLVLAAAKRAEVDAVVTSDKRFIAHATAVAVPGLTPQQALDLINALP